MPSLVPSKADTSAAELPLRLTGTDGEGTPKADKPIRFGVVPGVVTRLCFRTRE